MVRYLMKNNMKLMLRNKWIIGVMIMGPILVIAVLSSAFEDLMKSYEKADTFQVGYRMEENGLFADYMGQIKEAGKEAGIVFTEYPEGEPEKLISGNELAGFVAFGEGQYVVYETSDYKTEGITLEYFISRIVSRTAGQAAAEQAAEQETAEQAIVGQATEQETAGQETVGQIAAEQTTIDAALPVEELDYMPAIDSKDYYGIVYIVYFIWAGIICISGVLSSEKKNGITKKFQVSPISESGLFLSRWIPCVAVIIGGMTITIFICAWMFGINWGNIPWSIFILFLAILAATAFGLFLFYIFNNLAVTVVAVFTIVWFMGFVGGSFETYMFSSVPERIQKLSPIYYLDRTLVEYSCMGESSYTSPCILYMLVIIAVCSVGALLAGRIRRRMGE